MNAQGDPCAHPFVRAVLLKHTGTDRINRYREWYRRTKPRKYGLAGKGAASLKDSLGIKGRLAVVLGSLECGVIHP
jgi:hypothetical protein